MITLCRDKRASRRTDHNLYRGPRGGRRASSFSLTGPLSREALADQPLVDQFGDLVAVLVHHHHVRVALDADVGQVEKSTLPPPALNASA